MKIYIPVENETVYLWLLEHYKMWFKLLHLHLKFQILSHVSVIIQYKVIQSLQIQDLFPCSTSARNVNQKLDIPVENETLYFKRKKCHQMWFKLLHLHFKWNIFLFVSVTIQYKVIRNFGVLLQIQERFPCSKSARNVN